MQFFREGFFAKDKRISDQLKDKNCRIKIKAQFSVYPLDFESVCAKLMAFSAASASHHHH